MKIRNKILLCFLTPSLIIGSLAIGIGYHSIRKVVERNIYDQLEIAADETVEYIRLFFLEKKRQILHFSSDGFIREYTERITNEVASDSYAAQLNLHLIDNKKPLDTDILALFVVDLVGKVISSTEAGQTGLDVSGEAYFSETLKKGSHVSDLYHSHKFNKNTYEVSRLLFSNDRKKTIGVIVANYRGDSFGIATYSNISGESGQARLNVVGQAMRRDGLGKTGEIYIVNSDKLMVTDSRFINDAVLRQVVDTEGVQAAFENGTGMAGIYPDYRGVPIVGVSRYFEEMDWAVVAEKDVAEAFAPAVRIRTFAITMGTTGIIVLVIMIVFIAREITWPIHNLVTSANVISRGNLNEEINLKSRDEIGVLASSFDAMRIKLGILLKNIEESKKDWESTFDSVRDIIILWGKDCGLIRCNKALLDNLDVKFEDIAGKNCREIFPEIRKEDLSKCSVIETTKTLKPVTSEIEIPCLNGFFSISSFPRFNTNGEFTGTVQVMNDITRRKQAEEELKMRLLQYSSLSEVGLHALSRIGISELMDEIVSVVAKTLRVEYCKVLELLPDEDAVILRAGVGWKEGYVGKAKVDIRLNSQAGYTLLSKEPVIVEDLHTETRFRGPSLLLEHGVVSGMSVIIQGRDRPFGVLGAHTAVRRKFTKNDVYFLQAVANILANAIERNNAYKKLNKYREDLEVQVKEKTKEIHFLVEFPETSPNPVLRFNRDGVITYTNPAMELIKKEMNFDKCVNIKEIFPRNYEQLINTVGTDKTIINKEDNLKERAFLMTCNSLPGEENAFIALYDITDRKRAEEELWKSDELKKRIIESSVDCIKLLDLQGNLLFMSKGGQETLEIDDLEPLLNKSWINYWKGADHKAAIDAISIAKKGSIGTFQGFCQIMKDNPKWWDVVISPIYGSDGKVEQLLAISRNITKSKMYEETLVEARHNAEVANRAKSEFLANMSHELKTPLNSVIGFSEILIDKSFGEINEKQEKYLHNIHKSGKHLLEMINDIMDLSRSEAGKMELELKELSLPQILNDTVAAMKPAAVKKNIEIKTYIDEKLSTINADEVKVRKIINILLDNAVKFTPDGGKIRVGADSIEDKVQISVTDTGIGVKSEDQDRIFKGFDQADGSYTRKHGGAGLGLALAGKYVKMHRGKIWVESPPGKGTALEADKGSSFIFTIPCKPEQPDAGIIDPTTRLLTWEYFFRHIERILLLHKRINHQFGLLCLKLEDGEKRLEASSFAKVLKDVIRKYEIFTHDKDKKYYYTVLLDIDREKTDHAAMRISEALKERGYASNIKTVIYPEDGDSVDALLKALSG